jgi:hypothetical protein
MPEEEDVKENGEDEGQCGKDPNDEGEEHPRQDDGLLMLLTSKDPDLLEELAESRSNIFCLRRFEVGLED